MEPLWIAMFTFAMIGAVSPGPVNIVATSTSANYGLKTSLWYVLGASITYATIVFCSGSLLRFLAIGIPDIAWLMKIVGTLFLLYLAKKIAFAPYQSIESISQDKAPNAWQGAFLQCINPKAWLVAMSGISLYVVDQPSSYIALLIFTMISLAACLVGVASWAFLGQAIRKVLHSEVKQTMFNRGMAGLLVVSIASIWL
ncbi:LysE family translocator [Vibrio artabrorum]|uniref:LysE family translocator n=1 Tax=Vibrio artabrorum TaxID=446374 RepID=A0ABT8CKV7_9VIBR|nr:LysE family translocator [Vibrio artabrorum]MDN3701765.1 LysE family translocator [Vibrio artabrorum]